jgi:hypothetical protein
VQLAKLAADHLPQVLWASSWLSQMQQTYRYEQCRGWHPGKLPARKYAVHSACICPTWDTLLACVTSSKVLPLAVAHVCAFVLPRLLPDSGAWHMPVCSRFTCMIQQDTSRAARPSCRTASANWLNSKAGTCNSRLVCLFCKELFPQCFKAVHFAGSYAHTVFHAGTSCANSVRS